MKRIVTTLILGMGITLLTGCGEKLEITAQPLKNVDAVKYQNEQLDVYCPTGICQFELSTNKDVILMVNMYYSESKPFDKIEGVSVTGRGGESIEMGDRNNFRIVLDSDNPPSKIQIVDYYRN